jgi:predicted DNA-binding antitoxin AbrB/MazE fold protein
MSTTIEAVYENGVLRLSKPLPLKESEKVLVTVEPQQNWSERTAGLLKWTGDAEVLRQVVEEDEFSILESP